MDLTIRNEFRYFGELYSTSQPTGTLLASHDATAGLGELVDEAYMRAVLAEQIPGDASSIEVSLAPRWKEEPVVDTVEVVMTADGASAYTQRFPSGPWARQAQLQAVQLRREGTLGQNDTAYYALTAVKNGGGTGLKVPPLQAPPVIAQSLEQLGVRRLGEGGLVPDRPVLVNQRLADDGVTLCEKAGLSETGGAVLGKIVRLPEPLQGTTTRTVTVLTSLVEDERHVGKEASFEISPEGLQRAATIADLRGLNERVVTIFHTHGWSPRCGNCSRSDACPLPRCSVSAQDYILLQTLFPAKDTLMPISGRKLGAQGDRPVFRLFAWNGGEMRSIRWQSYFD